MSNVLVSDKELPAIKSITPSAEPTWADDAGRDTMDGKWGGSFIGYFTNLEIEFNDIVFDNELDTIKQLIEHAIISVTYPLEKTMSWTDANGKHTIKQNELFTEQFYGTAIKPRRPSQDLGYYEGFSISLVAVERRPLDV